MSICHVIQKVKWRRIKIICSIKYNPVGFILWYGWCPVHRESYFILEFQMLLSAFNFSIYPKNEFRYEIFGKKVFMRRQQIIRFIQYKNTIEIHECVMKYQILYSCWTNFILTSLYIHALIFENTQQALNNFFMMYNKIFASDFSSIIVNCSIDQGIILSKIAARLREKSQNHVFESELWHFTEDTWFRHNQFNNDDNFSPSLRVTRALYELIAQDKYEHYSPELTTPHSRWKILPNPQKLVNARTELPSAKPRKFRFLPNVQMIIYYASPSGRFGGETGGPRKEFDWL